MSDPITAIGDARRRVLLERRKALLKEQLQLVSEEPAPVESEFNPDQPLGQFLMDQGQRGLGLGAGAPIDLIDMATRATFPDNFRQGEPLAGQTIGGLLGYEGLKPPSAGAKFGGRVVEEVTAGAPFSFMPVTKGATMVKNLLANTGLSTLSGTGAATGQQAGGTGSEMLGQVGLGVVAPAVVANKVGHLKNLKANAQHMRESVLNSEAMSTGRQQSVLRALSEEVPINAQQFPDEVQDVVEAQIREIQRRQGVLDQVPGVRPTLATVTGSRVTRQREADVAARSAIDEAERLRLDQSNQLSLRTFAESGVPASDKNIKAIARERRRSLTTEQAALDRQLLITQNKVNEVSVLNSTDLSDSGEVLRSQHAIEVKKLTDEAANKYRVARRINASLERPVELDATGVTSLHKEYIDDPLFDVSPQDMPNVFSRLNRLAKKKADDAASILDASGKPMRTTDDIPAKVDYEEYHAMRQAVNQDIQVELGRTVPNRRRVRALTRMKKRIDKMGNQLKETEPALYQADLDANTFYRDEVAPKAFRGINHKMGLGEDRLANEKVVEQYWKPKGVTNARRFKALYGDNEAANAALEGGVLRLYRDTVVKNGAIDTMAHARFMKRYEENFNEFPQLRQILNDKDAATRTLNQRAGELADNIDEINDSIWFKHVDFGDKEPSRIIKDALKNPRTMSRTVLTMPKHQREAFAASLLSDVYESSRNADGFIDAGKLDALMSQHSEAIRTGLRHGFGATKAKAHMARLKVVSEAADILAENTVSITTTGKGTRNINIGRFDTGIPLTTAVSQARAVQTGRTGIHYVLAVLSTQTGLNANKQMTEALEKKLLYDPDTSLELIRMFKAQQKAGGMPDVARMKQFVSKSIGYVFGEGQVQRNLRAVAPKLGLEGRTEAFGEQEQQ